MSKVLIGVQMFLDDFVSRKCFAVETEQGLVGRMLTGLRRQLLAALPDFGQHLGYDGKAIDSYSATLS